MEDFGHIIIITRTKLLQKGVYRYHPSVAEIPNIKAYRKIKKRYKGK